MTALRAVAVIGFLLTSRLKNFSFNELRDDWHKEENKKQETIPQIDYNELAMALQKVTVTQHIREEKKSIEPSTNKLPKLTLLPKAENLKTEIESAEQRIAQAYEELQAERKEQNNGKPISTRDLAQRAKVRRATCNSWLKQQKEELPLKMNQQADM